MINLIDVQSILIDAQPYVLAFIALFISISLLTGNQDMFESVLNYIWHPSSSGSSSRRSSKSERSRHEAPRTRAQQIAARTEQHATSDVSSHKMEVEHYPGLVNMSGTYCFLNSPLQALASLAYLQPQLESIHEKAEEWDVPTPVIDAVRDVLNDLNTPRRHRTALRPFTIVQALAAPDPTGKRPRSRLFSSREHQDAQELFQLLSSSIQDEANEVDTESQKDLGLASVDLSDKVNKKDAGKTVFGGLTANRRSCLTCGYTEAVMHFPFDNLNLAVPRLPTCSLQDCLGGYTQIELLNDCVCRKCSMMATLRKLTDEANRLAAAATLPDASSNKRKRAKEAIKLQDRVQAALESNRIEEDVKDVKIEKVFSPCSTKQVMIARPPAVLVVHLNRSSYLGYGAAHKNSCRVVFPEILDLTPYTTSGALSTKPQSPISAHQSATSYILSAFQDTPSNQSPTSTASKTLPYPALYRLSAVVSHYGGHSFGHYVCFRRKPGHGPTRPARTPSPGRPRTLKRPRVLHALSCTCDICTVHGRVRDTNHDEDYDSFQPPNPAAGWLRISDDNVEEVGLARVLAETSSAFLLFYERVVVRSSREKSKRESEATLSTLNGSAITDTEAPMEVDLNPAIELTDVGTFSPRSSQETVTPENVRLSSPISVNLETKVADEDASTIVPDHPTATDPGSPRDAVPFPRSSSPTVVQGRIVRSVSSSRSRKASASSASVYYSIASNGTTTPNGVPSPSPSGKSPPLSLGALQTSSIRGTPSPSETLDRSGSQTPDSTRKARKAAKKQAKGMNGEPKAPPRTIDLAA